AETGRLSDLRRQGKDCYIFSFIGRETRAARSVEMKVVGPRDAATRRQNNDLAAFAFRRSAIAGHLTLINSVLSLLFPKPFKRRAPFVVLRDRNFDPQDR